MLFSGDIEVGGGSGGKHGGRSSDGGGNILLAGYGLLNMWLLLLCLNIAFFIENYISHLDNVF